MHLYLWCNKLGNNHEVSLWLTFRAVWLIRKIFLAVNFILFSNNRSYNLTSYQIEQRKTSNAHFARFKLKSESHLPSLCMAKPTSSKVKFIFSNDSVFSSLTLLPTSCSCKNSYCTKLEYQSMMRKSLISSIASKRVISSINILIFHIFITNCLDLQVK